MRTNMYCVLHVLKVVYEFYVNVRFFLKNKGELQKILAAYWREART